MLAILELIVASLMRAQPILTDFPIIIIDLKNSKIALHLLYQPLTKLHSLAFGALNLESVLIKREY